MIQIQIPCDLDWAMLLQYITVFRYPILIFWIIFYFRENLKSILSKVKSLKYGEASVDLEKINEQQSDDKLGEVLQPSNYVLETDEGVLQFWEDEIVKEYDPGVFDFFKNIVFIQLKFSLDDYQTDKKVKRLINYSVVALLEKSFESIYNAIYGSQIKILQDINTFGKDGVLAKNMEYFYEFARDKNPELYINYEITMEVYFRFLIINQLIEFNTEKSKYIITDIGVEFLKWMVVNKKSLNKAY